MNSRPSHIDAEVVVVGAGPVGSFLSGILSLNGIDVALFEQDSVVSDAPRSMAVNARTAEIFEVFSLREEMLRSEPSHHAHYGTRTISLARTDVPWPGMWPCVQSKLTLALRKWATEAGTRLVRGSLRTVTNTPGGSPTAWFDGDVTSASAPVLVGSDGENSSVRGSSDVGVDAFAGNRRFITANVRSAALPEYRFHQFPNNTLVSTGRIDASTFRVMMHVPADFLINVDENDTVSRAWQTITGSPLEGDVLAWTTQSDRSLLARSFFSGRLVLAGDAAHSQLPIGGCSLNYGIEDAFNLAWRIGALLLTGDESHLATYGVERRSAALRMQRFVDRQVSELYGPSLLPDDLPESAEEDEDTKAQLAGTLLSEPLDPGAFVSGIDVDYTDCGTGASMLASTRFPWIDAATSSFIKNAQSSLMHSLVTCDARLNGGPSVTVTPLDSINVDARSELAAVLRSHPEALCIRPDGYLLSASEPQRHEGEGSK